MYLRNGRIGTIDLASGDASEEALPEEGSSEGDAWLKLADDIRARHGEDSLVLGTGLLTGSLVPAACAGFVVGKRASGGARRIAPVLGLGGTELKLTGFDLVVIKGRASEPSYLWIRDGIIELVSAQDMRALDSWARTDRIRQAQGDQRIQVIATGPWGDAASASSQLVMSYWGGEDKAGLGADLGEKNLLAIAFRGMGELEVADAERHFEEALALSKEQLSRLGPSAGLASYAGAADREDFSKLVHRHVACFGCPYPCRSYLKVNEDPKEMRLSHAEPGYLHYDVPALEAAFGLGLDAKDATLALMACAKGGAEPVAAFAKVEGPGVTLGAFSEVLAGAPPSVPRSVQAKNFEVAFSGESSYLRCLGLGLCPRYWSRVGLDMDSISACAESALGKGAW